MGSDSFHALKNAKTAMLSVNRHPATTDVTIEEELGHAEIEFRFSPDASLSAAFAMRDILTRSGFEEMTKDSQLGDKVRFEWDKMNLTDL